MAFEPHVPLHLFGLPGVLSGMPGVGVMVSVGIGVVVGRGVVVGEVVMPGVAVAMGVLVGVEVGLLQLPALV